jgi:CheY-like chemotaxis protein
VALHILLADDSVPAQNMGKKILADAGYDVTTVSNGLEALRKISERAPDIAILDIFMPGYSGLEVCQKLRAAAATAMLPVILTVGKLEPYRPEDGEKVHSNAVIVKPFAAEELVSAVRSLVGGAPAPVAPVADDPLQYAAAAPQPLPSVAMPVAPAAEPLSYGAHSDADPLPELDGASDEPLFSYDSPLSLETESLKSTTEGGVYEGEPLLGGDDSPESLVFNPDARRTPFSASVADLGPSSPSASHEETETPFTEFALESSQSVYASGPESANDPDLLTSLGAATHGTEHVDSPLDPLTEAPGSGLTEAPVFVEPTVDPLLDNSVPEVPKGVLESSALETADLPEAFITENAPSEGEETLSPEEEARRKAFEDLFNAEELPPLEDSHATVGEMPAEIELASLAPVAPETAVPAVEPGPAPIELGQELQHIPERDPLLEETFEYAPAVEDVPLTPAAVLPEADAEPLHEIPVAEYSPEPLAVSEPAPEAEPVAEAAPAESQEPLAVEAISVASPEPVAAEPEHAVPEAHAQHSVLGEVVELATGAGIAAALPEIAKLVESEVKHAFGIGESTHVEPGPVTETPATPEHVEEPPVLVAPPEPIAEVATPAPEVEAEIAHAAPAPVEPEPLEAAAVIEEPKPEEVFHSELEEAGAGAGFAAALAAFEHVETDAKHEVVAPVESKQEPVPPLELESVHAPAEAVVAAPVAAIAEPLAEAPVVASPEATEVPAAAEPEAEQPVAVTPAVETIHSAEVERVQQAVERVFERFKPLLVAAIVRELARHD